MRLVITPVRSTAYVFVCALMLMTVGHARNVFALDSQSITLSPASTSISLKPGSSYTGYLTVLNNGDKSYAAAVYAKPYHVKGLDYTPEFTQLPGTTNITQWIQFSKTNILIPAHQTVTTPYTMTAPGNEAPGGYYAVIFVETQSAGTSGVQVRDRVGDILYVSVEGVVHQSGKIISLPLPVLTSARSLPISLEVSNTGGVHFITNTTVTVTNMFNDVVFSDHLQHFVLPQTMRKVTATWRTSPFGVYQIARSTTVAGHEESLPKQWIVIIQPWVAILVGALLLLAAMLILRKCNRAVHRTRR